MKHVVLSLFVLATFATAVSSEPASPHLKLPGPAAQDLMLGTWAIQIKYEPSAEMPKGSETTGRETWRAGPGGNSVIKEYYEKSPKGTTKEFIIAWWDEKEQGQRSLGCSNEQMRGCELSRSAAKWEGNSLIYTEESTENGQKVVRQEIFTDLAPTSFTQLLKAGPSVSELKTTVTIHATKLTARAVPMSL